MSHINKLEDIASQVRRDILRMVHHATCGHPGGSIGCADFMTALYFHHMKHEPNFKLDGKNEDIFILSNGHISPVFYSVLARSGYFPLDELKTFRKIGSRLQGHPATLEGLPGVRIATGSLGQGLSVAIGAALSKKLNNDKRFIYCLMGDGELQEGQNWEAFMYASANKVDNIIVTVDYNGQQIDGSTEDVLDIGNLKLKLESFNWKVLEIENGNSLDEVYQIMSEAKESSMNGKPIVILMKTIMGNGVDFMMHTHKWHGVAPNDEQLEKALNQNPETLGDY